MGDFICFLTVYLLKSRIGHKKKGLNHLVGFLTAPSLLIIKDYFSSGFASTLAG